MTAQLSRFPPLGARSAVSRDSARTNFSRSDSSAEASTSVLGACWLAPSWAVPIHSARHDERVRAAGGRCSGWPAVFINRTAMSPGAGPAALPGEPCALVSGARRLWAIRVALLSPPAPQVRVGCLTSAPCPSRWHRCRQRWRWAILRSEQSNPASGGSQASEPNPIGYIPWAG